MASIHIKIKRKQKNEPYTLVNLFVLLPGQEVVGAVRQPGRQSLQVFGKSIEEFRTCIRTLLFVTLCMVQVLVRSMPGVLTVKFVVNLS